MNIPTNRNVNRSIVCIIGVEGVLAYEYKTGPYNALAFINCIYEKTISYFNSNTNKILFMDNARFHKTAPVIDLFIQNKIAVKYLIPYSPELNQIEEFFQCLNLVNILSKHDFLLFQLKNLLKHY